MRNLIILILVCCSINIWGQRAGTEIPVHSIHGGFFTTTSGANTGIFLNYQYYKDEQISYSIKPGMTGFSGDKEEGSYFLFAGMNYRFTALRKPVRKRPLNTQPYAGFYPLTFDYVKLKPKGPSGTNFRLGLAPSGIIGYTLIFFNLIDLDMHAGFGISFRMGGGSEAGSAVEPTAFAGIGLGIRL